VQIIIAMIVAIVWFALDPLKQGSLQIGDLVAFIEYSFHALLSFLFLSNLFTMYPRTAVSSERLKEIMDMPISIDPNEDGIQETETHGYLEFDNVTFAYPGETESPVLHNISFTAKPGETIAFIGSTGSGKSTLVQLIPRFYDVTLGKIKVDGVDVRDYRLKSLRQKIGFIPETPSLYEELTLREHIETVAMAYDVEQKVAFARVEKLLTMFRLKEKLDWFPVHFSKGMKQKVMIICAFVVDPSLFIVDEPFLGLDPVAIADLIELLEDEKAKGKSILMSTHVLDSAEKMCDSFVILHKGEIRAKGNLAELRAEFAMPEASLNDIYLVLTEEASL